MFIIHWFEGARASIKYSHTIWSEVKLVQSCSCLVIPYVIAIIGEYSARKNIFSSVNEQIMTKISPVFFTFWSWKFSKIALFGEKLSRLAFFGGKLQKICKFRGKNWTIRVKSIKICTSCG